MLQNFYTVTVCFGYYLITIFQSNLDCFSLMHIANDILERIDRKPFILMVSYLQVG